MSHNQALKFFKHLLLTFLLLTYMATILSALRDGVLEEFALPEWELREPLRPLLVAPSLFDWVDNKKELHDGSIEVGGRTPFEHLEQMFSDLRCSERPAAGDLRRMMPNKHGVWKAHPETLRIYGWVYLPLHFVAVAGALADETKTDKKLNDRKRDEVRKFVSTHKLQETVLLKDWRHS